MGPFRVRPHPQRGSWLNMAEIEINAMVSQCLDRRMDSIETVRSEVAARQIRSQKIYLLSVTDSGSGSRYKLRVRVRVRVHAACHRPDVEDHQREKLTMRRGSG